jgi:hypothetical protein
VVIITILVAEGWRFESGVSFFCILWVPWYCRSGILAMLTTLVAGRLGVRIPTNNSCVLSPPASYMGLACQDGYIALRCKNFELYDNLRKISSNLFIITNTWITSIQTFINLHDIHLSITDTLKVRYNGPNKCLQNGPHQTQRVHNSTTMQYKSGTTPSKSDHIVWHIL